MSAHVGNKQMSGQDELHSDGSEDVGSDEECLEDDFDSESDIADDFDPESDVDDDDDDGNGDADVDAEADADKVDQAEHAEDGVSGSGERGPVYGNFGWADAMLKVLNASKPKNKKTVILAKAKKDVDVLRSMAAKEQEVPLSFQIDGEIKEKIKSEIAAEKKQETYAERMLRKQKRKEWDLIGRVKPDITIDREREKTLSRIATRGVVQLFNSVKTQQKVIQEKLRSAGPLERKREKVLKSFDKSEFLDMLSKSGSKVKDEPAIKKEKASWSVLRDDFMPQVKMRDWDKQDSSGSEVEAD